MSGSRDPEHQPAERRGGAPEGPVDLTRALQFRDLGLSLLALALAQGQPRAPLQGLSPHQRRLLHDLGLSAAPARRRRR